MTGMGVTVAFKRIFQREVVEVRASLIEQLSKVRQVTVTGVVYVLRPSITASGDGWSALNGSHN